jgi:hypothetical protein
MPNLAVIAMLALSTCLTNISASVFTLASDSAVQWSGRVFLNQQSVQFDWPGVQFETRFQGDSLCMDVEGRSVWDVYLNYQYLGQVFSEPERNCVVLVNGLEPGLHKIRVIKSSETQTDLVRVFGFKSQASLVGGLNPPSRRIEFIGDSYTVGFGNQSPHRDPPPGTADSLAFYSTNSAKSFASILGRGFGADYQINAFSGRGLVSNYDGIDPGKEFRFFYDQTLVSPKNIKGTATPWDFSKWHPQVIVISLGINDFQSKNSDKSVDVFKKVYQDFLEFLRKQHPGVKFILCATTIWPNDILKQTVSEIVTAQKSAGHNDVLYFEFGAERTGLYWHPDLRDHENIARELRPLIAKQAGWLSR